jgi:hypothetical protein
MPKQSKIEALLKRKRGKYILTRVKKSKKRIRVGSSVVLVS